MYSGPESRRAANSSEAQPTVVTLPGCAFAIQVASGMSYLERLIAETVPDRMAAYQKNLSCVKPLALWNTA